MTNIKTNKRWFSKKYLVYEIGTPEMGSEGGASYYYYAVCEGSTEEEIMKDYSIQVKNIYNVNINPVKNEDYWSDYYKIVYNELPNSIMGSATKLEISR